MREVVLDASVVLKWFTAERRGFFEAREMRDDYEAGQLSVVVPSLFFLELLNVAGRRWRWEAKAVVELAETLADLSFEVSEPELPSVASWVSRGLTPYDAAYVALAEKRELGLVTDDAAIVEVAPDISRRLAASSPSAG
ncbi:MAG: type II toxin-antitoxin system VapC family toxin [Candidatus Dormibacteria bacterium]